MKLFVEMEEGREEVKKMEEQREEVRGLEDVKEMEEEGEEETGRDNQEEEGGRLGTEEPMQTVEVEEDGEESEEEEDKMVPKPIFAGTPVPMKASSVKLVRVSLGSVAMGRATPPTSQPVSINPPFKPSPLTTHVHSAAVTPPSQEAGVGSPYTHRRKGLFTPVLTAELMESKRRQLHSSLEATKQKYVSEIRTGLSPKASVSIVKDQPSATMVIPQLSRDRDSATVSSTPPPVTMTSMVTTTPISHGSYGFSPPTEPVSPSLSLFRRTLESQPMQPSPAPSYIFSPPLTRSASRRRAQPQPSKDTPPARDQSFSRHRSHARSLPMTSSQDPVSLLTPPTPFPHRRTEREEKEKEGRRRKSKPVRTVATRRSKRLLMQDNI